MKRYLLIALLFPLSFLVSCVTYDFGELQYKDKSGALEKAVVDNVIYDPYADKLYFKSQDDITKAYRTHLQTILDTDAKRKHFWGMGLYDAIDSTGKTISYVTYWRRFFLTNADMKPGISQQISRAIPEKLSDNEIKDLLGNGWIVVKSGPTQTSTDFKGFKVPLRFYWMLSMYSYPTETSKNARGDFKIDCIDIVYTLAQDPKKAAAPENESSAGGSATMKEKLTELKRLYDDGLITEAEYNQKRQAYLDSMK
jgi:hypothetical protein